MMPINWGVRCLLVIAGGVFDVPELILRGYLTDRDHLQAVFLAIGRVDEQVFEVAGAFALPQGLRRLSTSSVFWLARSCT